MMNVALDIDGTIVFQEPAELEIPGRTGSTYIARRTAELLKFIGDRSQLYLASARNGSSVAGLVRLLPNVKFAGFVLECGLVVRARIDVASERSSNHRWMSELLDVHFPTWQQVDGYEEMVCCIAADASDPCEQIGRLLEVVKPTVRWQYHQERHKTFVYPDRLCKVQGLKKLGVTRIDFAAGDDAMYDRSMLEGATYPLTTVHADASLVELMRRSGGYVATQRNHAAATQILEQISARLTETKH